MKIKLVLAGAFALLCAPPGAAYASSLSMNATTCYDPLTTVTPLGQGVVDQDPGDYVAMWGPQGWFRYYQDAYNSPHLVQDLASFGVQTEQEMAVGTYTFALFNRFASNDPLEDYCTGDISDPEGNLITASTAELCETEDLRYIETTTVEFTGACPE